jgi:Spy/CpxP family protein refolding chaperone
MFTQHANKRPQRRLMVLMAVAVIGVFAFAGCNETSTDPSTNSLDVTGDLTMTEVIEKVKINDEQATAFAPALDRWRQQRRSGSTQQMGALTMLAEASELLDHEQMVALVNLVAEKRQERMQERGNVDQQRRGPGMRGGDNGPSREGQPGRMGPGGPNGQHGPQHGRMSGGLLEQLDLTADQQAAIQVAREEMRPAMQALSEQFRNGELTREEMRAAREQLREQMHATIADILTPEQNAQLAELRDAKILGHLESALERLQDNTGERQALVAQILNLTEQQIADATALRDQALVDFAAIVESLRSGQITGVEARQAVHDLRDASFTAFRDLLTVEQQELFDALKNMGPRGGRGLGCHR